jgi:hypothetical protein
LAQAARPVALTFGAVFRTVSQNKNEQHLWPKPPRFPVLNS